MRPPVERSDEVPAASVAEICKQAATEFQEGQFSRSRNLLARITTARVPPQLRPAHHTLLAEVLYVTGDPASAVSQAVSVLSATHDKELTARCHLVCGSAAFDVGEHQEGLKHLQKAEATAKQAHDLHLLSRCQLRLLSAFAERSPAGVVANLTLELRRNILKLGTAQASASLHITQGRIESRRGLLDHGWRHLDLARALLARTPNPALESLANLDSSVICGLASDVSEAIRYASLALNQATEIGYARTRMAATGNLGLLWLYKGQISQAERFLAEALRLSMSLGARSAFLESLAQLQLHRGAWSDCERLLKEIDARPRGEGKRTWYELATYPTRIRLAQRQQQWAQALTIADEALAAAHERSDRLLGTLFQVLKAETLLMLDRGAEAETTLAEAIKQADGVPMATRAEIERVRGKVLAHLHRREEAESHYDRAIRVLASTGNAAARSEVEEDRTTTLEALPRDGESGELVGDGSIDSRPAPHATVLESAALLMELGAQPELLGREAFALLQASRSAAALALVAERPGQPLEVIERDGQLPTASSDSASAVLRIPLGVLRERAVELRVMPRTDLEARSTVHAIRLLIDTAVSLERARREEKLRTSLWPPDAEQDHERGVFVAEMMRELHYTAQRVAQSDLSLLITGETGTGKEQLAREIHLASTRAKKAFVPFNCTAVPREMVDSQLFGYKRGAFTGATDSFVGVIRGAAGGTLFLDEVGELGTDVQPKLLRFLETSEVHPLGEAQPVRVNVRVIAATNANLEQLLAEGRFREDLYYRLNVVRLRIPPLRERREEIPALINYFLRKYGVAEEHRPYQVSDEALEYFVLFGWPGNVRQLANEVRRVLAFVEPGATIVPAMLSPEIQASRRTVEASAAPERPNTASIRVDQSLDSAVDELELLMIRKALAAAGGRVERAAQILGISRKGLFLKRRRFGLDLATETNGRTVSGSNGMDQPVAGDQ